MEWEESLCFLRLVEENPMHPSCFFFFVSMITCLSFNGRHKRMGLCPFRIKVVLKTKTLNVETPLHRNMSLGLCCHQPQQSTTPQTIEPPRHICSTSRCSKISRTLRSKSILRGKECYESTALRQESSSRETLFK